VPEPLRRFSGEIRSEFESACEQILAVKDSRALLDSESDAAALDPAAQSLPRSHQT